MTYTYELDILANCFLDPNLEPQYQRWLGQLTNLAVPHSRRCWYDANVWLVHEDMRHPYEPFFGRYGRYGRH